MSQNSGSETRREYDDIHEQIIRGNLRILKQELIHILYKLYLHQFLAIINSSSLHQYDDRARKRIIELFEKQKDFSCIDQYSKEISHIEPIIKNIPVLECLEKDEETRKIFCQHYIIYLSQYTYEVLLNLKEKNHYQTIDRLFFHNPNKYPALVVVKNLTDEGYVGQNSLNTKLNADEINSTNSVPYHTGLHKEDFL